MSVFKTSEKKGHYIVKEAVSANEIVTKAKQILNRRFAKGRSMTSVQDSKYFLTLKLGHLEHEVFSILFLDNKNRVIAYVSRPVRLYGLTRKHSGLVL